MATVKRQLKEKVVGGYDVIHLETSGDQIIEDSTHRLITDTERTTWNGKQAALGFTAENVANKKTSLADNSDTFYPSQKAVKTETDRLQTQIIEKTSYDVVTGLVIAQQASPNMTVQVSAGTIYMANGDRFTPTATASLAVATANATNPRIDIVYVSSLGVVSYLAGTAGNTPTPPSTPAGGQVLATILVTANKTSILATDITQVATRKGYSDYVNCSDNLYNRFTSVGGYLKGDGGVDPSATYVTSDFIQVDNITSFYGWTWAYSTRAIAASTIRFVDYFTENKGFISHISTNASSYTSIPSNAKYMKVSLNVANKHIMITKSSVAPTKYIPYYNKLKNGNYYEADKLRGKMALFCGDSICYGEHWRDTDNDYLYPSNNTGWARLLRDRHDMVCYGYGVSGTALAYNAVVEGSTIPSIYSQVASLPAAFSSLNPEYIILEGGVNDVDKAITLGTISGDFTGSTVMDTTLGALENMFSVLKTNFPNTKIGFIIPHRATNWTFQQTCETYYSQMRAVCNKWSVPYIDLHNVGVINGGITTMRDTWFKDTIAGAEADAVHPNKFAYGILTDIIEKWMARM